MNAVPGRKNKKRKICYVLSYRDPTYVRTRFILNLIKAVPSFELVTAINTWRSPLRYLQTLGRLVIVRIFKRPQVYILGFRGHELYWPVRILTFPKPLIFDEFINMDDWLTVENSKVTPRSLAAKIARVYVYTVLNTATKILTDTNVNAQSSSKTYGIARSKYKVLYVGTDETVFFPRDVKPSQTGPLNVFFYGNMVPLHGVDIILEAAQRLKNRNIRFTIVGGKGKPQRASEIRAFIRTHKLDNVDYKTWMNFNHLPEEMARSHIFIGGPLGDTSQSRRVVTGKTYQSMATAVPTLIGAIDEAVGFVDKKNCLLVEQGSVDALVAAFDWALKHRKQLPAVGQAGYKLYCERFSVQAQADAFRTIIDS